MAESCIADGVEREAWNRRWKARTHHCADDPVGVLAEEVAALAPGRALDLGCGAGRVSAWLAERGWKVTGVDFSDVALAIAKERSPGVDWVLADVVEYEPEPGAFDLVLVLFVHLAPAERRTVLSRAAAALAPGGTIVVLGHDLTNLGTGAPGPSRPEVLYTPEGVAAELPGLAIGRAERITRRVETEDGHAEAVDTLVVATAGDRREPGELESLSRAPRSRP
jgi:SAM-dependent methyltransferase